LPGDGESEPAAFAVGSQRAIEGVEHPCALGGRDAGAVVEDVDSSRLSSKGSGATAPTCRSSAATSTAKARVTSPSPSPAASGSS
jgi:hypothetical protein